MAKCILMCAGDYVPLEIEKREGDILIAVDNGFKYCLQQSLRPDYVIGDFDSLDHEYQELVDSLDSECCIRLPKEKDDTDTIAAVKLGLELGYKSFHIYGAMGGKRMEHTLANLQTLLYIKNQGANGYLLDDSSMVMVLQNEEVTLHEKGPGYLSLFAMGGQAEGVSISGMKYNLENAQIRSDFPIGISNEFVGEYPTIEVKNGALLAVLRWTL